MSLMNDIRAEVDNIPGVDDVMEAMLDDCAASELQMMAFEATICNELDEDCDEDDEEEDFDEDLDEDTEPDIDKLLDETEQQDEYTDEELDEEVEASQIADDDLLLDDDEAATEAIAFLDELDDILAE